MSAKFAYGDPFDLHLLNLCLYYFLMLFVSFGILVFCRSLKENNSFKVKNAKFERKYTLRRPI
jgi:hypothetical protein